MFRPLVIDALLWGVGIWCTSWHSLTRLLYLGLSDFQVVMGYVLCPMCPVIRSLLR